MKKLFIYPFFLLLVNLSFAQYTINVTNQDCGDGFKSPSNIEYEISNGTEVGIISTDSEGKFTINLSSGNYVITPKVNGTNYTSEPTSLSVSFPNDGDVISQNFCFKEIVETVQFTDARLERFMLTGSGTNLNGEYVKIDINEDGIIQKEEAENIKEITITLYRPGSEYFYDSNGLEFFINLEKLVFSKLRFVEFDLSHFPKLKWFESRLSSIKNLDFNRNPQLEYLSYTESKLEEINIWNCRTLRHLNLSKNNVKRVNVSNNPLLEYINLGNNVLTNLVLSMNTNLKEVYCDNNHILSSLTLPSESKIEIIRCEESSISSFDLSAQTYLKHIQCQKNQIEVLDLSQLTKLEYIDCSENKIQNLDLTSCPVVSNIFVSNNGLKNIKFGPSDRIEVLECGSNELIELPTEKMPKLNRLHCSNNQLTKLNLKNCPNLGLFFCFNNKIEDMDLSANNNLGGVGLSGNPIKKLNLKNGEDFPWQFDVGNLPDLEQVCVDEKNIEEAKRIFDATVTTFCTSSLSSQDFTFSIQDITVSPNPVQDQLSVSIKDLINATFEIFNLQGQKVKEGEGNTSINVSDLSKGIYLMKIKSDYGVFSSKFVKE